MIDVNGTPIQRKTSLIFFFILYYIYLKYMNKLFLCVILRLKVCMYNPVLTCVDLKKYNLYNTVQWFCPVSHLKGTFTNISRPLLSCKDSSSPY